jgi:hypothetical protein
MTTQRTQTTETKLWLFNGRRLGSALGLAAVLTSLFISVSSAGALARGGPHQHSADVTFTRWATTLPSDSSASAGIRMVGVVGGDIGPGRFAGEMISDAHTTRPHLWLGHVRYSLYGHEHSFIADVHITEDDDLVPITATIQGVVTQGWLKGDRVTGQYRQWDTCPIPTPGNVNGTICFLGTIHLQPGFPGRGKASS